MDSNYSLIDSASIKEAELKLIGELFVSAYNALKYEQMTKKVKKSSSALAKHSACLKKAEASKHEAETYRILSCLYESTADRPAVSGFLDALISLLDR
jgi:hypothetical protein